MSDGTKTRATDLTAPGIARGLTRTQRLIRNYALYAAAFYGAVYLLTQIERSTGPGAWVGYVFLFVTIAVYAVIGLLSRTSDITEYYVAGRSVPAAFNGMATAADWLSAASFIGLAGSIYANGYDSLAYIMGWTGGFCLVAFMLAPYMRKLARYTLSDFIGTRYNNKWVRIIGVICTLLCSFVYLVAQLQGVGLIAARFIGVDFEIGIFCGLAGILVCSFLGGMRAVTWTQVAQYIILIGAFLIPVSMIAHQEGLGWVPQFTYGRLMQRMETLEAQVRDAPAEIQVRALYRADAKVLQDKIDRLPASYAEDRLTLEGRLQTLREQNGPLREIETLERTLAAFPRDPTDAAAVWSQQRDALLARATPPVPMHVPFPVPDDSARRAHKLNFIALMLCLMLGTASLPHILTRYNTTTSVASARRSVGWTLFFIALFYLTVPVLAVLIKYEILTHLVGQHYGDLPEWVIPWRSVDPHMLSVIDANHDGVVQWSEIAMHPDMIVLAAPEIAGLPYVLSGLVAAGALAAALSTADGLLLTIANTLSHDVYYTLIDHKATAQKRVIVSKVLLLSVALLAAWVASLNTGNILFLVGAAFSIAASSFFPVLVLAVFWKRTTPRGAIAGMVTGLGVCVYYIVATYPYITRLTGYAGPHWFGVEPISAGVFGVPAGFAAALIASLLDRKPDARDLALVDYIRRP